MELPAGTPAVGGSRAVTVHLLLRDVVQDARHGLDELHELVHEEAASDEHEQSVLHGSSPVVDSHYKTCKQCKREMPCRAPLSESLLEYLEYLDGELGSSDPGLQLGEGPLHLRVLCDRDGQQDVVELRELGSEGFAFLQRGVVIGCDGGVGLFEHGEDELSGALVHDVSWLLVGVFIMTPVKPAQKKERCLVGRAPVEGLLQHDERGVLGDDEPEFQLALLPEVQLLRADGQGHHDHLAFSVEDEVGDLVVAASQRDVAVELQVACVHELEVAFLGHGCSPVLLGIASLEAMYTMRQF